MTFELEAIWEQRIRIEEFFGNPRAHSRVEHVIVIIIALIYESYPVSVISSCKLVTIVLRVAKDVFAVCSSLHTAGVLAVHQMHREKSQCS